MLQNSVMEAYHGTAPHARPAFMNVVRRVLLADAGTAKVFWTEALKGFSRATELTVSGTDTEHTDGHRTIERRTGIGADAARLAAAAMGVTVASVVNAAWALVLHGRSGDTDIVFGVTTSGRSGAAPGEHETIGLLINTLPLRVQVAMTGSMQGFVQHAHQAYTELIPHETSSLSDIQTWCLSLIHI